jgi:hypothetical protein
MSVGLVDGVRIGSDVGVEWRGHLSAQSLLRDQATRNFANRVLWQTDPDCILLRERFHHLSDAEVRSLAIYAGMSGGAAMTSDALDELRLSGLRLWKRCSILIARPAVFLSRPIADHLRTMARRLAFASRSPRAGCRSRARPGARR